jgi:two-component system sensor histidine kinase/response regulator
MRAVATVLVVDDNSENRALARETLGDEGYRVLEAKTGQDGVSLALREKPDCILMDVRMPGVDGIAACEQIRAAPEGGDVAIIFVTAQRDVETFDRALAAGGDDFMTKPFRPAELVVRIQTALRLRRIAVERSALYAQLKQQRDALQRIELQKEQLVAFLVHDLKNPVNSIDLSAQQLERSNGDPARAKKAAGKIREETRALLRMITNLLDISKADEGRLAPAIAAIDASMLVRDVIADMSTVAQRAGVSLSSAVSPAAVQADRDLISRVLANLVDNAIRHAPEGSSVTITSAPAGNALELRVMDRGPGVPPDMRELVFERFRSGAQTATRTNRGLGLAFCKLAVEAHGGRIWIEDGSPGAVFCVRLGEHGDRSD